MAERDDGTEVVPIYLFIDESGNLDFSGKGSDHFVLSAFLTTDPLACGRSLMDLRYEFLHDGDDEQLPFHATYNSHKTRDRVVDSMCAKDHVCWVHSIHADKHLAHPSKNGIVEFYSLVATALAKYMLLSLGGRYSKIVMVFDSALATKQKKAFLGKIKPVLNQMKVPYVIAFSPVKEDPCGQTADYYAWALFRSLERKDGSWLAKLPHDHDRFDIFRNGHTRYW